MRKYGLIIVFVMLFLSGCSEKGTSLGIGKDCSIKGNISYNTGEKIYHLPGDEFYNETNINTSAGEAWFCSEAEAEAEGFRRTQR